MSSNNYSILPIVKSDLDTLAQFVQESKLGLTINRLLWKDWPDEATQLAHYTTAIQANWDDPDAERFKVVDKESGLTVGHLVLTRQRPKPKEDEPATREGEQKPNVPKGMNVEVFLAVMAAMGEVASGGDVDHLSKYFHSGQNAANPLTGSSALTHVYIKPAHRGKGLREQLVHIAIDKAESAGIPLYLTSEPEGHDLYLKLGFKDTKHADIDLTRWAPSYSGFGLFRLWAMVR
jgi:GNAT superfamily N-acetyltransferase